MSEQIKEVEENKKAAQRQLDGSGTKEGEFNAAQNH